MSDSVIQSKIRHLIEADGPMDVATFMQLCLTDPDHGYYTTNRPIGANGDFTTAPEISQLFGELIGIWIIDTWQKLGAPTPFSLIEPGPGRGTLMADILRTIKKLAPECIAAIDIHLIDVSPTLQKTQNQTLSIFDKKLHWHKSLQTITDQPFILIANEFLDALPIRQYQHANGKWTERAIGLSQDNALTWGLKPTQFECPGTLIPKEGDIFETCAIAQTIITMLSKRIKQQTGAALFIDYGHHETGFGDTFQAVKNHKYIDPLITPGEADLTAHVDFGVLKNIAESLNLTVKTSTQGEFLIAMGLLQRAGTFGAKRDTKFQEKIRNDVERLAAPDKMGNLFKVMVLTASDIQPHGF